MTFVIAETFNRQTQIRVKRSVEMICMKIRSVLTFFIGSALLSWVGPQVTFADGKLGVADENETSEVDRLRFTVGVRAIFQDSGGDYWLEVMVKGYVDTTEKFFITSPPKMGWLTITLSPFKKIPRAKFGLILSTALAAIRETHSFPSLKLSVGAL